MSSRCCSARRAAGRDSFPACAVKSWPKRRAASPSCARERNPKAISERGDERPGKQAAALRRAVHAGIPAFQLSGACAVQRVEHGAGCARSLRLHLRGLGGAHRFDGTRRRGRRLGAERFVLHETAIVFTAFAYLGVLFAIAYYADGRADAGRSIIASPYVYSLSLAVYATAWTFYGSVGRAASAVVGFLPIYIGPTLMIALWWLVLRKILRISKQNRITSLADFIASRYGKSALLGGIVTIIAVIGILPYISLQLKAVSTSYSILVQSPAIVMPQALGEQSMRDDTALWVALILAAFTIAFGTRHLDAAEHHQGMVAAIAFESLVKLVAFLAVGAFVTYGIYNGVGDLFSRAAAEPKLHAM